ncbi:MAG: gliding motility lipoprotein GldH [Ferruginibacter sp.]
MFQKKLLLIFSFVVSMIFFISCRQVEVFEKNTRIPAYDWASSYAATGSFNITDTLSSYKIYIVIRHLDAYRYNNIWLNVGLQTPGDSMYFQKVDLPLGSDAQGWEGTGMNDIWEVRKLLSGEARRFIKPGMYKFKITQLMRDDPLPGIMSAGLRIEKQP